MKIYNILTSKDSTDKDPIFLSDGFNFKAFIFGFFWTIYHKMWKLSLYIVGFTIFISILNNYGLIPNSIHTALSLLPNIIAGVYANEWLYSRLIKKNYVLASVVCEKSLIYAKSRYFNKYAII